MCEALTTTIGDGADYTLTNQPNTGSFTWYGVRIGWLSNVPYTVTVCWMSYPNICGTSAPILVSGRFFDIGYDVNVVYSSSL